MHSYDILALEEKEVLVETTEVTMLYKFDSWIHYFKIALMIK